MKKNLFVTAVISALCAMVPIYITIGGVLVQSSQNASEVQEVWGKRVAHVQDLPDEATDIAIDLAGNIYVTGKVSASENDYNYGTAKYDGNGNILWGPLVESGHQAEAAAIALDDAHVYITGKMFGPNNEYNFGTIKYNRDNGDKVWSRLENSDPANPDEAVAIAVEASGNVYVAGNSFGSARDWSYKVIKYDSEGNRQWSAHADANENDAYSDKIFAMAIDATGNVYVTGIGYNDDEALDDYMTIKYDGDNGQVIWKKLYHGDAEDQAIALALDGAGHVYVTGRSRNSLGDWDYVTLKYDAADGNALKTVKYNAGENDIPKAMSIDELGSVYVTGGSQHTSNDYDYLTIKYNTELDTVWTRRYNNPAANIYEMANDLALDATGNVYVTGMSDRGQPGGYDYATIKYDAQGAEVWVIRYEGPGDDIPSAIATNKDGEVYVTGYSEKSSGGDKDYLTIKYAQTPAAGVGQTDSKPADDYELMQNYPNPFNPDTKFVFALPRAGEVKLNIYSLTGQLVRELVNSSMTAGRHEISWNGQDRSGQVVANGVYWYQLIVTEASGKTAFRQTKKMTVLK